MANASEIARISTEVEKIKQTRKNLNTKEKRLYRGFIREAGDLPAKHFFRLMYQTFGSYRTIRMYNKAYFDGKDIVKARRELLKMLNTESKCG